MRRLLLVTVVATLALAGTASAHGARITFASRPVVQAQSATTFVNADATEPWAARGNNAALWSSWAANSDAPAPPVTITIMNNVVCGDPEVPSCREVGQSGLPAYGIYSADRDDFYFEMGGIFDSAVLTDADRRFLARKWGAPRWHWWDTDTSIEAGAARGVGVEDGLEGVFAAIYQDCAWGHSTVGVSYSESEPAGMHIALPSITTDNFDTCAWLRHH